MCIGRGPQIGNHYRLLWLFAICTKAHTHIPVSWFKWSRKDKRKCLDLVIKGHLWISQIQLCQPRKPH